MSLNETVRPSCPRCGHGEFAFGVVHVKDDKKDSGAEISQHSPPTGVVMCAKCGAVISFDPHYWDWEGTS
jgi:uncharacterized protein (DUF983 family)